MLGGWVFPQKSLRYSLYRWVPPFYLKCLVILGSFAKGLFGDNMVYCCLYVNNLHIQSTLSISSFYPKIISQKCSLASPTKHQPLCHLPRGNWAFESPRCCHLAADHLAWLKAEQTRWEFSEKKSLRLQQRQSPNLVGGFNFNPSEKYSSTWIISPICGMKLQKKKELPTHPVVTICPQTTLGTSIISTPPIFPGHKKAPHLSEQMPALPAQVAAKSLAWLPQSARQSSPRPQAQGSLVRYPG